ncbi:phage portal protein [Veillonella sp.]|uniref:phage portal protein n=1 Tax=Veillonella sp. TaxID=1926307 RepID=UPI0025FBFEAA|nr:phage portal protein [Veillonella sp.]
MQKRSLFEKIFGFTWGNKEENTQQLQGAKLLNGYDNLFTMFDGKLYDDSTIRTCIDTIARHFSKIKIRKVIRQENVVKKDKNSELEYILTVRPNPFMNASDFLEKVVAQYYTYNNAFVYIKTDKFGHVLGIYPIDSGTVQLYESTVGTNKELFLKFQFMGGEYITVPYGEIVHLRRHFNRNEFWGDSNEKIFAEDINTLRAVKAAIINVVKSFGKLRGIIKWKTTMRPEDQKENWQLFVDTYTTPENGSGIGSMDNKADFQQLNDTVTTFDSGQMDYAKKNVLQHFGLSEGILLGNYKEDEYISFYESVIEPLAVKFAQELTEKIFTEKERRAGHEIIMESNRLSFMSVSSKIKICQTLIPAGGLTINEIREIFGYAGIEGGDERQISLNFVKAGDQSKYQVNDEGQEPMKGGDGDGGNSGTPNGGDDDKQ